MTVRHRKVTGWIAIAAMLFGAVSPALAAALFADHAEILRRMLAIPAAQAHAVPQAVSADDDSCPHEAPATGSAIPSHAHHDAGAGSHETPEHAAHGIFCSFCLTAGSVVTLMSAQSISLA